MERKTDDTEKGGQNGESHKLNWLSSNGVDGKDSDPITRNGTSTNQDQISNGVVVQLVINVGLGCVANLRKNDGVIKTETIKCDIKQEPRPGSSEDDLSEAPLSVMTTEIGP